MSFGPLLRSEVNQVYNRQKWLYITGTERLNIMMLKNRRPLKNHRRIIFEDGRLGKHWHRTNLSETYSQGPYGPSIFFFTCMRNLDNYGLKARNVKLCWNCCSITFKIVIIRRLSNKELPLHRMGSYFFMLRGSLFSFKLSTSFRMQ